jgi:hypothetical protein
MDVEQRDGRGKRQGNEVYGPVFDTAGTLIDPGQGIRIFLYVTARSFDGYVWQAIEAKATRLQGHPAPFGYRPGR